MNKGSQPNNELYIVGSLLNKGSQLKTKGLS